MYATLEWICVSAKSSDELFFYFFYFFVDNYHQRPAQILSTPRSESSDWGENRFYGTVGPVSSRTFPVPERDPNEKQSLFDQVSMSLVNQAFPRQFSPLPHQETHVQGEPNRASPFPDPNQKDEKSLKKKVKPASFFSYDDVISAYHRPQGASLPYSYSSSSHQPTEPTLSTAASNRHDHSVMNHRHREEELFRERAPDHPSIYHSANTVPYNERDYKQYPYGFSSNSKRRRPSLSHDASHSFASVLSEPESDRLRPAFFDSSGEFFFEPFAHIRGFAAESSLSPAQSRPSSRIQSNGLFEERMEAPSGVVSVEGRRPLTEEQIVAAALKPRVHSIGTKGHLSRVS